MDILLQVVINGVLRGGLYALMALGLALVWGVLNIVNLAHGVFIMVGAYVSWFTFTRWGLDPFLGLPLTALVMFVLGYGLQRGLLNLIARAPMFDTLLVTFGLGAVFSYLVHLVFSVNYRTISPAYFAHHMDWLGVSIPSMRLAAFCVAIVLTLAVWYFLLHTRMGRAIRAMAQNLSAARLHGVEPRHLYAVTFGLGLALAGVAGGLYGIISQFNPYIGTALSIKCFAIAIIGGMGSPLGVIVGGLLLGIIEGLTALYVGPTYINVASFGVLVLVLVVRPQGLFGRTA